MIEYLSHHKFLTHNDCGQRTLKILVFEIEHLPIFMIFKYLKFQYTVIFRILKYPISLFIVEIKRVFETLFYVTYVHERIFVHDPFNKVQL